MNTNSPQTIDAYIKQTPAAVQEILRKIYELIRKEVPEAQEKISYQIPTFTLHGKYLVYFAAFKNHIGFFPTASDLEAAIPEAAKYRTGKGTLQFPLDQPIPYELIRKIVAFRVTELSS